MGKKYTFFPFFGSKCCSDDSFKLFNTYLKKNYCKLKSVFLFFILVHAI